jgi:hypothetical protein
MADWTTEDVAARFAEAAETGRRLPRVQVQGYFNVWPAFAREAWETYPEDEPDYRPLPPSLQAIERMLETMRWVQWLEVEQRHVVWMRARRYGWRDIALRAACCPGRRNATGNVQSRALPTGSTKRGPWHHEKILIGLSDTFGLLRKPARHCQIQSSERVSHLGPFFATVTAMVGKGAGAANDQKIITRRLMTCHRQKAPGIVVQRVILAIFCQTP